MNQQALLRRIEREALKASRQAKRSFKLTQRTLKRKPATHCAKCGVECENLKQYTDDTNMAINLNSPELCPDCYRTQYGFWS